MFESERLVKGLLDYIKVIDESDRENEGYSLPKTFSGRQIMYKSTNRSNFHLIWIIGIIIAILLYLREKKNKQRAMEYRQSSLLKDYPDIVSKLMIFIGADEHFTGRKAAADDRPGNAGAHADADFG